MTKFFRMAVMSAIAFGLMLSQSQVASAQSINDRAAVVVKLNSADKVLSSVGYMVKSAGFGGMVPLITLGAGQFLDGLNTEKPMGGYLTFNDGAPAFVGFMPMTDLGAFLDVLEENAQMEIEEDGDDYILITPTGEEIVVREKGGWAFMSNTADNFGELPADPAKLVSGIDDKYMVGVKAYVQRVPAALRSQAIEWMEEAFQQTNQNLPEGAAEFQKKMNEQSLDQIADMIQETDEVFFGFAPSKKDKALFFDFSFTAKKGSELAKKMVAGKGADTDFGAFLKAENAAMTMNAASKISAEDAEGLKAQLSTVKDSLGTLLSSEDSQLSEEDQVLVKELLGEVIDVALATMESGKADIGAAVLIDDEGLNAVFAAHVADAKKVEAVVKKLIAERGDKIPPEVEVELDASTYKGYTMHLFSGTIPEEEAQMVLGETTTLVVAIGKDKIYGGFGASPVEKVKAMIDAKATTKVELPSQINIKLSPILRLVGRVTDQAMLGDMAEQLEDEGNQMIRIYSDYIENGTMSRVEIQEGILSLIGTAGAGLGGGGFGGDF